MFWYVQYYLKGIKTEYIATQPSAYVNRNENCHNYIFGKPRKLYRAFSISFNSSNVGNFSGVEFSRLYLSS